MSPSGASSRGAGPSGPGAGGATPPEPPKILPYPGPSAEASHARGTFAVWIFLISDSMFFIGLIGMYLVLRGSAGSAWPPPGIPHPGKLLPAWNTLLLLAGSGFMLRAHRDIRANRQAALRLDLAATALTGFAFLAGQCVEAVELTREGLTLRGSTMGNVLYTLAGFHGLHVLAGLAVVLWLLVAALRGRFSATRHFGVVGGGMFWHFLNGTWLILFVLLFLL